MFVKIVVIGELSHDMTRVFNNLQNEEVMVELDDARDKATEVLKRLLHTQKVRHDIQRIVPYPTYNYTVQCVVFCYWGEEFVNESVDINDEWNQGIGRECWNKFHRLLISWTVLCQTAVFLVLPLLSRFIWQYLVLHVKARDTFQNFFMTKLREHCLSMFA